MSFHSYQRFILVDNVNIARVQRMSRNLRVTTDVDKLFCNGCNNPDFLITWYVISCIHISVQYSSLLCRETFLWRMQQFNLSHHVIFLVMDATIRYFSSRDMSLTIYAYEYSTPHLSSDIHVLLHCVIAPVSITAWPSHGYSVQLKLNIKAYLFTLSLFIFSPCILVYCWLGLNK